MEDGTARWDGGGPRVVGPPGYDLVRELGRGGTATVWLAVQRSMGRMVAVKVVPAPSVTSIERLRREARVLGRLHHPNIASVIDLVEHQGALFVIQPLYQGRTLAELLHRDGHLRPGPAIGILAPIGSALAAVHALGIVHRDVKPSNILLSADGSPALADFGLAFDIAGTRLTSTGNLLGTIGYVAPEVLDGSEPNPAADAYAFGVVAYQCIAGRRPYEGTSIFATADAARRGGATPLGDLVPGLPFGLSDLVGHLLHPDPRARQADLGLVAAHLASMAPVERVHPALIDIDIDATNVDRSDLDRTNVDVKEVDAFRGGLTASLDPESTARGPRRARAGLVALVTVLTAAAMVAAVVLIARRSGQVERASPASVERSSTSVDGSTTTVLEPATTALATAEPVVVQATTTSAGPSVVTTPPTATKASAPPPPTVRTPSSCCKSTAPTATAPIATTPAGTAPGGTTPAGTTPATTSTAYPNAAEQSLLSHIPVSVKGAGGTSCRRAGEGEVVAKTDAGIVCSISGADRVSYHHFALPADLDAQYGSRVAFARDVNRSDLSGPCSATRSDGESAYSSGVGRLLCYVYANPPTTPPTQWIEWKHEGLQVYAFLSQVGADTASAFGAWNNAGPT